MILTESCPALTRRSLRIYTIFRSSVSIKCKCARLLFESGICCKWSIHSFLKTTKCHTNRCGRGQRGRNKENLQFLRESLMNELIHRWPPFCGNSFRYVHRCVARDNRVKNRNGFYKTNNEMEWFLVFPLKQTYNFWFSEHLSLDSIGYLHIFQ